MALLLANPVGNHDKPLFFEMVPPSLLIFEGESIALVLLHSTKNIIESDDSLISIYLESFYSDPINTVSNTIASRQPNQAR